MIVMETFRSVAGDSRVMTGNGWFDESLNYQSTNSSFLPPNSSLLKSDSKTAPKIILGLFLMSDFR